MPRHFRGVRLSGSFPALVLAMALLGPLPAVALGAAGVLIDDALRGRDLRALLGNAAIFMTFSLLAGALFSSRAHRDQLAFAAAVVLIVSCSRTR